MECFLLPRYSQYRFALACVAMGWNCPCSCFFFLCFDSRHNCMFVLYIFVSSLFFFPCFNVPHPRCVTWDGSKVACPLSCCPNLRPSPLPFSYSFFTPFTSGDLESSNDNLPPLFSCLLFLIRRARRPAFPAYAISIYGGRWCTSLQSK